MATEEPRVRIELTPEQKTQIKEAVGQEVVAFELSIQELEQRIVPVTFSSFNFTKPIDVSSPQ
jgi:type VI protein secretion system component Hcp